MAQAVALSGHPRWRRFTRRLLGQVMAHLVIILVGLFFFVPFLWMLSTALKSEQDVFRIPPTLLPHDNLRVEVNGQAVPVYDVEIDGQVKRLALLKIAEGHGTFVD
ncbi:MAG: hypothetical protein J7M34_11390, partial [Anaerolineae bacterium]|nr:hypothetical protein [Anaerolineae bacterium]